MNPDPHYQPVGLPPTLHARAEALTALWPEAGRRRLGFTSTTEVLAFLELELGRLDALESARPSSRGTRLAVAPRIIYHLCASNLDISAETSLFLGLLLGARLHFKLPKSGLPAFTALARSLPEPWAARITLWETHDPTLLQEADAVVLFGSDATVEEIRRQTRPGQRVLMYGHKASAGLILPGCATQGWAEQAAWETAAYSQSGCLSPLLYLCPSASAAEMFAQHLTGAMAAVWPSEKPDFAAAAAIIAARDSARLRGSRVLTPGPGAGWTVELAAEPSLAAGPGHGYLRVAWSPDPWEWLIRQPALSALSITQNPLEHSWLSRAAASGATLSRICPTGRLQEPPLDWPHDGRPRLADLLRWISLEAT